MKVFRRIVRAIFLILTFLLLSIWYLPGNISAVLSPLSLIIIPFTLCNVLLVIISAARKSKSYKLYIFTSIICLYLCSKSFSFHPFHEIDENSLRLVSWNAEGFLLRQDTLYKSSNLINSLNPDIICIQERPHDNLLHRDKISSAFKLEYKVFNSREDEVLNMAVYSKWPIVEIEEYYFPGSYNKILRADILYKENRIRIFNIHLQTTGLSAISVNDESKNLLFNYIHNTVERNRQADILSEEISRSPYPVIVCGDMNDAPVSYSYHNINSRLVDSFKKAGTGWAGTFQPSLNLFRIDYIFNSQEIEVMKSELYSNRWSDHKIQYAEFSLTKH